MISPTFSWLDVQFVEKVLKSSINDESIEVTNLALKFATAPGDNFSSDMIRASVEYSRNYSGRKETEKKSLIIKIAPAANRELAAELGVFNREIEMMKTTLVNMAKLSNEEGYRLSAHVMYTNNEEPPFIVMEDLTESGYRMGDRLSGLDLEHCIVAMRGLAKFHASSVALWEKNPEALTSYTKGVFHNDNPKQIKQLFVDGIKVFAKEVLNWSELGASARSYSDKLLKLSDVCYEKATECARAKVADFNVMNHGDCWINNMLFRYNNEGKVVDNIFVDFQVSWWTSPAVDIINFANTSLSEDVELHHRDAILLEYFNTLTKTMTRLRCSTKGPNLEEFKQILREHEFLEIMYACVYLPMTITPKTATKSFEEILSQGDRYVNPAYKELGYRRRMLRRLSVWNASGILDV